MAQKDCSGYSEGPQQKVGKTLAALVKDRSNYSERPRVTSRFFRKESVLVHSRTGDEWCGCAPLSMFDIDRKWPRISPWSFTDCRLNGVWL
ncbi:hypothetical protein Y032_0822g2535 [Ancylostoma ceylanicum]|uniref:Uncharacterized protein n=1 Tax=Ancylostoma ceylanicum TaxID=53326 RepID=A0A016WBE0_9BILA|nr:hypothetical protein Y032_0822g2535 [Ancylostoma ceylanicum]